MTDLGLSDEVVDQLRFVLKNFSQVEEVVLYGSRAKGTQRAGSDIDLTLIGPDLTLEIRNEIGRQLDDLSLPYNMIDLSICEHIQNPALLEHIGRVGIWLYKKDRGSNG